MLSHIPFFVPFKSERPKSVSSLKGRRQNGGANVLLKGVVFWVCAFL